MAGLAATLALAAAGATCCTLALGSAVEACAFTHSGQVLAESCRPPKWKWAASATAENATAKTQMAASHRQLVRTTRDALLDIIDSRRAAAAARLSHLRRKPACFGYTR